MEFCVTAACMNESPLWAEKSSITVCFSVKLHYEDGGQETAPETLRTIRRIFCVSLCCIVLSWRSRSCGLLQETFDQQIQQFVKLLSKTNCWCFVVVWRARSRRGAVALMIVPSCCRAALLWRDPPPLFCWEFNYSCLWFAEIWYVSNINTTEHETWQFKKWGKRLKLRQGCFSCRLLPVFPHVSNMAAYCLHELFYQDLKWFLNKFTHL